MGKILAKDKEAFLEIARKRVQVERDELGRKTTVESTKDWNIGGLIPIKPPFGFSIYYYKKDGEEGKWFGSVHQYPSSWIWLTFNSMIIQLPTGARLESPHGKNFSSEVISGEKVSEWKYFGAGSLIEELVECFEKGLDIQVRVGHTDFKVPSSFLAYVVALKELVEAKKL
jgi:hypothetical protein